MHRKLFAWKKTVGYKWKAKNRLCDALQGCNVELTEVRGLSRSDVWWILGFEAFGDLDTVPINLNTVTLPERSVGIVASPMRIAQIEIAATMPCVFAPDRMRKWLVSRHVSRRRKCTTSQSSQT